MNCYIFIWMFMLNFVALNVCYYQFLGDIYVWKASQKTNSSINCHKDYTCNIYAQTRGAFANNIINCNANRECNINCGYYMDSCSNVTINCGSMANCNINCRNCYNVTVNSAVPSKYGNIYIISESLENAVINGKYANSLSVDVISTLSNTAIYCPIMYGTYCNISNINSHYLTDIPFYHTVFYINSFYNNLQINCKPSICNIYRYEMHEHFPMLICHHKDYYTNCTLVLTSDNIWKCSNPNCECNYRNFSVFVGNVNGVMLRNDSGRTKFADEI
eukprot:39102_1